MDHLLSFVSITINLYLQFFSLLHLLENYSLSPLLFNFVYNVFFSALFFTPATASPMATRELIPGCHPNFAGSALTLSTASGSVSWSPKAVVGNPLSASTPPSKFFFQQNGFPIVDYTVLKTMESTNFALELNSGAPSIGNTDPSGSNVNQKWMVDCTFCMPNDISQEKNKVVAKGCSITSTTNK
ncbi:hypothetical protein EDD85DRAFT_79056 [Armillaria nabsnona]|nr:hypothetical protein EDD85DRAFT_575636 [Armillaria nabsnona]KAK0234362.1 hypothetical protein EDD85DRAFT_79056 [Armillaria nabsnona]